MNICAVYKRSINQSINHNQSIALPGSQVPQVCLHFVSLRLDFSTNQPINKSQSINQSITLPGSQVPQVCLHLVSLRSDFAQPLLACRVSQRAKGSSLQSSFAFSVQSINQSINHQSINHSRCLPVEWHSAPRDRPYMSSLWNQPVNKSINQLINQSVNQLINQLITVSAYRVSHCAN
jgi:hypothetical protein